MEIFFELVLTAILSKRRSSLPSIPLKILSEIRDSARVGCPLPPDSNVDLVAVEFTVLADDNVTKIEPDA